MVGCDAAVVYKHLKPGRHTFRAKAVNSAGEPDRTPAVFTFKIKRDEAARRAARR